MKEDLVNNAVSCKINEYFFPVTIELPLTQAVAEYKDLNDEINYYDQESFLEML